MAAATNDPPSASDRAEDDALPPPAVISQSHLAKGKLVNVISRTWPGINKPGGIGKITKVYTDESTQKIKVVDVKYIVHGGTDKAIPVEFIEPHEDDGNRSRQTSKRCPRCKSFVTDCQNCDLRFQQEEQERIQREIEERKRLEEEKRKNFTTKGSENDDESMDSEEEEAHMADIRKRYREMGREAKRRSNAYKRQKMERRQKKKQNSGKNEEGDTDSDEENETLGALKEKKKRQRKKMKRRRNMKKASVLASLPTSTAKPNVSVSSKVDCGKSVKEDDRGEQQRPSVLASLPTSTAESNVSVSDQNGCGKSLKEDNRGDVADKSKLDDDEEEEMEFDFDEENFNQAPIEVDTDDDQSTDSDDESSDSDDEDNDFIQSNNDVDFEDQEASSDESDSDDDDDDDVKLVDLCHTDKTKTDDGQDEINNTIDDLLNTTIPYTKAELSRLKEVLKELKRSMAKEDCLDEIDELAKKSNALHDYVVKVLIRNGADKCAMIMRTLTKKKRRLVTAKMSKAERTRYFRQIDALDLRIDSVGKNIEDVDADVTNFQKEVDMLLEEAESKLEDCFLDLHTTSHKKKSKRNSTGKEWDPHQHASHKRKSSSKSYSSSQKRAKNVGQSGSRNANVSTAQHPQNESGSSHDEVFNDDTVDFDITSDVDIDSSEAADVATSRYQSIDDDSIGETDDLDNGPAINDTSRSWNHSSSSPHHKETSTVRRKRPGNRGASSNKRPRERLTTYRHIRRESRSRKSSSTTNSSGAQSRQSQALVGMGRGSDTNRPGNREEQQTGLLHSTRGNVTGQCQPHGRSSTSASSSSQRSVQNFLKPENLFHSFSTAIPQDNTLTRGAESSNQIHDLRDNTSSNMTNNTRPLHELCTSLLRESQSQGLDSSRETLSALSNSSPSTNEEVITLFQTLHTLLKAKCSTLLDALNCDPQLACFQMECWYLVFRLMEQNHHKQLPKADVLWKIFGDSTLFTRHVLIQIIDVLFSQLMGNGYGDAPRLTDHFFRRMRSLCRQIGRVLPILPELPLLFRNLPGQLWYESLIYGQKENAIEKAWHVSMLDPKVHHERFMIEGGQVVASTKENRRIDLYHKNLPRQEINALWTTIGFFTDASPIPSKKKEKMLAGFVQSLLQSKCGVLYTSTKNAGIPATDVHLDRCLHEIKWVCHLLSKSILGELSFAANFVPGIVKKAILLESTSVVWHMRPTAPQEKVDRVVTRLWKSSCLGSSDEVLDSLTFNALLTQNKVYDTWCYAPSTNLAQTCASLFEICTVASSKRTTKAYWNNFSREVDKLSSSLAAKAKEADMTVKNTRPASQQTTDFGTSFAHLFPELESCEKESVASPTGAFLREAACFSLLACVIASTRSDTFIPTPIIALNKCFREKVRVFVFCYVMLSIRSILNMNFGLDHKSLLR